MKDRENKYSDLQVRIKSLKENRERHEALILSDLSKIYAITQSPAPYLKQVSKDLAGDKDFRINLLKIGLNLGTNYLYKLLSGPDKNTSVLSLLVEKLGLKDETKNANSFIRLLTRLVSRLSEEKS